MVIEPPNTARPITTVSMPLSTTPASAVMMTLAIIPPDNAVMAPIDGSSPCSPESNTPNAASGPICSSSATICEITTTMVVRPSVALGLARM